MNNEIHRRHTDVREGETEHPFGYAEQDPSKRENRQGHNSVACGLVQHKAYGDHLRGSNSARRKACEDRDDCGIEINQRRLRKLWSRAVVLSKSRTQSPQAGQKKEPGIPRARVWLHYFNFRLGMRKRHFVFFLQKPRWFPGSVESFGLPGNRYFYLNFIICW